MVYFGEPVEVQQKLLTVVINFNLEREITCEKHAHSGNQVKNFCNKPNNFTVRYCKY